MRIEKYIFPCLTEFAYGDPAKRESKSTSFTLSEPYPLWRPPFWGKTRRPPPTPRGLLIPAASPSGAISDSPSGASGQSLPGNSGRPPGASGQPLRGNSGRPTGGNSGRPPGASGQPLRGNSVQPLRGNSGQPPGTARDSGFPGPGRHMQINSSPARNGPGWAGS